MLAGRHRALAEIDLEAIRHNVRRLMRDLPAGAVLCAAPFLAAARRLGARVHGKFDSGMGRLGVTEEEARVLCAGAAEDGLLIGLMSHFATADEADTTFFEYQ